MSQMLEQQLFGDLISTTTQITDAQSGRENTENPETNIIFLGALASFPHMHLLIFMAIFFSLSGSYLMQPLFSVSGYSIEFGSVVKLPLPSMLPLIWLGGFDLIACCCNSLWMLLLIIDMYPLWFCELILNEWKRAMLACIDSCKLLALAWHVLDIMAK